MTDSRQYSATVGDGEPFSAPFLDEIRLWLDTLPDLSDECGVYNPSDKLICCGTISEVQEQLREMLFPAPATKADVARLEKEIQEIKAMIRGLTPYIIKAPYIVVNQRENSELISVTYLKT